MHILDFQQRSSQVNHFSHKIRECLTLQILPSNRIHAKHPNLHVVLYRSKGRGTMKDIKIGSMRRETQWPLYV